ncbi:hypothetical protein A5885_001451 [Enterococcus sp. 8E11_MSG4843]|nr:hypothetical protein A5885_001451 [Enterococcus sp. 8E11_MSG4843]
MINFPSTLFVLSMVLKIGQAVNDEFRIILKRVRYLIVFDPQIFYLYP